MANLNITRAILNVIKNAAHSVSARDIQATTGFLGISINTHIDALLFAGYIKENRDDMGTYFTHIPKREAINAFINGDTNTLEGIQFNHTEGRDLSPCDKTTDILRAIVNAPEALHVDNMPLTLDEKTPILEALIRAGIIKEHASKPQRYFTRAPKRALIKDFLRGDATLNTLLNARQAADAQPDDNTGNTYHNIPEAVFADILADITDSSEALHYTELEGNNRTNDAALNLMVEAGLIKEHAEKPGYYFTRKPNRDLIENFLDLDTDTTVQDLFRLSKRPAAATASTTPTAIEPGITTATEQPVTTAPTPMAAALVPSVLETTTRDQDFEMLMAAMITVREIANAFTKKYNR